MDAGEFDFMQHDFDESEDVVVHTLVDKPNKKDVDRALCSLLPYDPQRWADSSRRRIECPACQRVSRLLARLEFATKP